MAIVERAPTGFNAFFPDLPCCVASGGNLEQLRQNAEGTVFDHLELSPAMHARMAVAMARAMPLPKRGMARMVIEPKGH